MKSSRFRLMMFLLSFQLVGFVVQADSGVQIHEKMSLDLLDINGFLGISGGKFNIDLDQTNPKIMLRVLLLTQEITGRIVSQSTKIRQVIAESAISEFQLPAPKQVTIAFIDQPSTGKGQTSIEYKIKDTHSKTSYPFKFPFDINGYNAYTGVKIIDGYVVVMEGSYGPTEKEMIGLEILQGEELDRFLKGQNKDKATQPTH